MLVVFCYFFSSGKQQGSKDVWCRDEQILSSNEEIYGMSTTKKHISGHKVVPTPDIIGLMKLIHYRRFRFISDRKHRLDPIDSYQCIIQATNVNTKLECTWIMIKLVRHWTTHASIDIFPVSLRKPQVLTFHNFHLSIIHKSSHESFIQITFITMASSTLWIRSSKVMGVTTGKE